MANFLLKIILNIVVLVFENIRFFRTLKSFSVSVIKYHLLIKLRTVFYRFIITKCDRYSDVIITGNLNENILRRVSGECSAGYLVAYGDSKLSLTQNWAIADWEFPTYFSTNGAHSLINLILSNNPNKCIACNQTNTMLYPYMLLLWPRSIVLFWIQT